MDEKLAGIDTQPGVQTNEEVLRAQAKAVVTATAHNLGIVIDQVWSMHDSHPLSDVEDALQTAMGLLEAELERL